MILPTRDGIDPDKFLIRRCLHILMSVLKTDKTADKCLRSAHTILVAIKGTVRIDVTCLKKNFENGACKP